MNALEHHSNSLPEDRLVRLFKALGDEKRLRILVHLRRDGELHVSRLCQLLDQSQPAVSHHLKLMLHSGLVERRRDGKHNYYSLQSDPDIELLSAANGLLNGHSR